MPSTEETVEALKADLAAKEAAAVAANVPKGPPSNPDDNASDIAAGIGSQSDALRARAAALLKMLAAASDA